MPHSSSKSTSKHDIKLFTRTIKRTLHAHEVFFSFSGQCCALLENPKGDGQHFIVSRYGETQRLHAGDDAPLFFQRWKASLAIQDVDIPAIQYLVYASYEVSTLLEDLPNPKSQPLHALLCLHQPSWSMCFQPEHGLVHLASLQGAAHLSLLESMLDDAVVEGMEDASSIPWDASKVQEQSPNSYQPSVERVKEYIASGDVFQVNIARFWSYPYPSSALLALYHRLRTVNPAPFSCFVQWDDFTILSSSPERLVSLSSDGIASTRPIAGTRRRSEGDDDQSLCDELLLSDKERAEHIMLVDLERNDLGRVCQAGSVEVDELMVIEKYPTVQHIVSNVRGKLDAAYDVVDLFCAMFPGGTITGCPKVRCMEIIHEMEDNARGSYTGSVGYIAWDGSADFNILIRTFWHDGTDVHWAAGAGIVADSQAAAEEVETEHKAAGLLRALL